MKKSKVSSGRSIRTVLLTVLLVLGGWGFIASLLQIGGSVQAYHESRDLVDGARVAVRLLTAAQHLAYERGRAAVVLQAEGTVSSRDRSFLDERRRLADASLESVFAAGRKLPDAGSSDVLEEWRAVRQLRSEIDRVFVLPRASRDPALASRWFDAASRIINTIQRTTVRLVGYFPPGDMTTRLMLLSSAALELRITADAEASYIAQALSAAQAPSEERLLFIHELRGREDRLWQEVDRLADYTRIESLKSAADEVKKHHYAVFRPLQDKTLSDLTSRKRFIVPLAKLTAESLPTLDGISDLMTRAAEGAVRLADEGVLKTRRLLIELMVWSASLLFVLLLSLRYVVRRVVQPLEQVDGELRRLGARPLAGPAGNEIDRLKASAEELKVSMAARAEAEAGLKRANDDMSTLNKELEARVADRTVMLQQANDRHLVELADRKNVEEALRKREAELNESQRLAHIGSWDWDADKDVIWWSDEYYRIYDIDTAKPTPNYEEHKQAYTGESIARLDAAVKRAMETGEPYELDLELAHPTETTRWIVARAEAKRDESGKIWGLRGTAQNITERKRTEAELRASEQRLALHFMQTPLGVIEWNLNFEAMKWNPAAEKIFGYRRDEALGRHASLIVPTIAKEHVDRIWNDLIRTEGGARSTNENVTKEGKRIFCEWYNTPLVDEAGKVIGVASLVQDVTDRKQAEEEIGKLNERLEKRVAERTSELQKKSDELRDSQMALTNIVEDLNDKTAELEQANAKLQELDRLKSLFIASMSHELRTPLNSIIGFSSIMLNEWTGPVTVEQKENLGAILRSGKHLLALINDVIDVSKIEAGKLESVAEAFDICAVVSETAQAFNQDIESKKLVLNVRVPHQPMRTDRRRLLQCLLNLVSNAVKFTEQGTISVRGAVSADGRCMELSVEDTGIGINDEDLNKLFAPFVRLVSSQRTVVPGTGLGLYLTRKLVREVLKGDIVAASVPGKGSTFSLIVPLATEGGYDAQSARDRGQ